MTETLEALQAELARQDVELERLTTQFADFAEAGVAFDIPPDFFEALDAICEVRHATSPVHMNAVRA